MKPQDLALNKTQITEILKAEAEKDNGFNSIMQKVLKALVKAERVENDFQQ